MGILDANPNATTPATIQGRARMRVATVVSATMHGAALFLLIWRPAIFIKPELIARGEGGTSTALSVPLYMPRNAQAAALINPSPVSVPAPKQKPAKRQRSIILENNPPSDAIAAGSPEGSALAGPAEGDEIRPAIPLPGTFADFQVSQWEIPSGVEGDVIVELTINDQGVVVDERLLQGIGHGIDERVIAALRSRRYRPATRNGIAIPSKQDFYRHFPS
jgi:protein TonB